MFDWFKKNRDEDKVLNFPDQNLPTPKEYPAMPKVEFQKQEQEPGKVYYRLAVTDNHRVSLQVGYSEITMNAIGVERLIEQLTFYKEQILKDYEDDSDES